MPAASESADAAGCSSAALAVHEHCGGCYSFTRCTRDGDACQNVPCSLDCGAVMHACKEDDHLDHVCPRARVPCVNADFGCGLIMARKDRARHLRVCPASVVMCMAEWNRWPVFTAERQRHTPFRQRNPYASEGQLDYDLALRDHRMLNNLGKITRKTRLSLRNSLTRRFPAVPLPSSVMDRTKEEDSGDGCFLDLGLDDEFAGVKIDAKLTKQMKQWQDDLEGRLKGKERPKRYWDYPELEKGNVHKHCAHCVRADCDKSFDWSDGEKDSVACQLITCRWNCGSVYHACKSFEHHMICPNYEEQDEFAWMYKGVAREAARKNGRMKVPRQTALGAPKEQPGPFFGPGEPARVVGHRQGCHFVPDPPPMPTSIHTPCRLDICLETVTRLQTKPQSMYTFVCAQEFRRDEIGWHARNIHNDLLGGLNNWIEHRCPMASFGCGFAARRLFPHDDRHTLKYSVAVESFGVVERALPPVKSAVKTATSTPRASTSLQDLPVEVLEKIFLHLDSFTLNNLSLASVLMRRICCSLLDLKGCVSLQWQRVRREGRWHWQVAYKRWFFSNAIDPIKKWHFCNESDVAEHMRVCPFNVRSHPKALKKSKEWDTVMKSVKDAFKAKHASGQAKR